jgi:hypothetical protein
VYFVVRQAGFGTERYANIVDRLASRCDVSGAGPFPDGPSTAMIYMFVPRAEGCAAWRRDLSGTIGSGDNARGAVRTAARF